MFRPRVIPCLLLRGGGLVKTVNFRNPTYIGDPINAVWIYNRQEADELIFLDITASKEKRCVSSDLVKKIGKEAYMPFAIGGGITTFEQAKKLMTEGAEKIVIGTASVTNPSVIAKIADVFGSQSVVVSIDVKKNFWGEYEVFIFAGSKSAKIDPVLHAKNVEKLGAGELLVNSIDRDGTMRGYDTRIVKMISEAVSIPVIACGGAGKLEDFRKAVIQGGAQAVAAGSLFVFQGSRRAVLINYPEKTELEKIFKTYD